METLLQAHQIRKILNYRYPFQLTDRVVSYTKGEKITAIKAVSLGEEYFAGHFPDFPIMPGVLIIEALAQSASLLMVLTMLGWEGQGEVKPVESDLIGVLGSVKINLLRPVLPGSLMQLEAKIEWSKGSTTSLQVCALVEDIVCAKGNIIVVAIDKRKLI